MSNILSSILIERPGATARRKAGRERKRAREWRVHGIWFCFHFVLIWLLSCELPQPSGYFPFTWALFQLLPCTHPARFCFFFFFCSDWCKAVGRRQGAKRGLISCQYHPPCSVPRPKALMLCINRALRGLDTPSTGLCKYCRNDPAPQSLQWRYYRNS